MSVPGHRPYCACEDCQDDRRVPLGKSEEDKIASFKLHRLLLAGYRLSYATQIAASTEADWHRAIDLLSQGCPQATAAEILL